MNKIEDIAQNRNRFTGGSKQRYLVRFLCASLFLALSLALTGCFAGRSVGRSIGAGALQTVTTQDSALIALQRRLFDSASVFLNDAFETAVLDPARVQFDSVSVVMRGTADSITAILTERVSSDLNESVQQLLGENLDLLEVRAPLLARNTAEALTDELSKRLPSVLATIGDTLGQQLVAGITVGLREVLEPALHKIMVEVTDSLRLRIRQVDDTVAESDTLVGLRSALIGGGLVLTFGIAFLVYGYSRRQRRALNALIDAIESRGDPDLHESVRSCADEAGVHDWLSDRVTARRKTK